MSKLFEFTPEDFQISGEDVHSVFFNLNTDDRRVLAGYCNAKLKEWLDGTPTVYGKKDLKGLGLWNWYDHKIKSDTHTAKLVCIEEIKK